MIEKTDDLISLFVLTLLLTAVWVVKTHRHTRKCYGKTKIHHIQGDMLVRAHGPIPGHPWPGD